MAPKKDFETQATYITFLLSFSCRGKKGTIYFFLLFALSYCSVFLQGPKVGWARAIGLERLAILTGGSNSLSVDSWVGRPNLDNRMVESLWAACSLWTDPPCLRSPAPHKMWVSSNFIRGGLYQFWAFWPSSAIISI